MDCTVPGSARPEWQGTPLPGGARLLPLSVMKPYRNAAIVVLAVVLAWGGYRAWMAHLNLVTLDVRNMDVRKVVSKIEWQTWERILVNKDVGGVVTMKVKRVPLDEVLNIIALQTSTRWAALFPLYTSGKSGVNFQKVVRGEMPASGNGWSNWEKLPPWQKGNLAGFGYITRAQNKLVSAQILGKDLDFTALALSRFSQARVVPEDGLKGTINLKLDQAPLEKAVALVAKQIRRKWDHLYALEPLNRQVAKKVVRTDGDTNNVVVKREEPPRDREKEKEIQLEAFLATMSAEEKKQAQEQLTMIEQMKNAPGGPQQAAMQAQMQAMSAQAAQAAQLDAEKRINQRLKNGTIDQRLAHDRAVLQRGQQGGRTK